MEKCLIIGNGRAGKRHAKNAESLGIKVFTSDPYVESDFPDWRMALHNNSNDYVVIASPPDAHLLQLRECIDIGVPTLCEKPLCSIEECDFMLLNEAKKYNVMLGYNWYFNKDVQRINLFGNKKQINLFAQQTRILPAWGIENDHLPHDIFIINLLGNGITKISSVYLVKSDTHQEVYVEGKTTLGEFIITERVLTKPTERISNINCIEMKPDVGMFDDMWKDFIDGKYSPSLNDGIEVQKILHNIYLNLERKRIL